MTPAKRYKYPRTPHLPWSPGAGADDAVIQRITEGFRGDAESLVVVTEKLDGENTTLYRDGLHARSLDSRHHPSRDWVKRLQGIIGHELPEGLRICGENMFARHSIPYEDLESYFFVFSVWNENICLSWAETKEWADLLGLSVVPTLYEGPWDEDCLRQLRLDLEKVEGYVVRSSGRFAYTEFGEHVAKWVRPSHVQTDEHWMNRPISPNGLRGADR